MLFYVMFYLNTIKATTTKQTQTYSNYNQLLFIHKPPGTSDSDWPPSARIWDSWRPCSKTSNYLLNLRSLRPEFIVSLRTESRSQEIILEHQTQISILLWTFNYPWTPKNLRFRLPSVSPNLKFFGNPFLLTQPSALRKLLLTAVTMK